MSAPSTTSVVRGLLEWIAVFVIAIAAVFVIRTFVVEPYVVPTGSMEPTIQIGDQVLVQKLTTGLGSRPQAGDIVVFRNPDATSEHEVLVKRVIATEGQTVAMLNGTVYVDGAPLDEPYAQGSSAPLASQAPGVALTYPFTVPENAIWVMGDNRENSADSRYFGAVSCDDVIGVAFARYWPISRIGGL